LSVDEALRGGNWKITDFFAARSEPKPMVQRVTKSRDAGTPGRRGAITQRLADAQELAPALSATDG